MFGGGLGWFGGGLGWFGVFQWTLVLMILTVPSFNITLNENTTRGHSLKLNKPRCLKSLLQNAFPARCIDDWNSLPNDLVCIEKLETFKNRLDVLWRGKRFHTSDIYWTIITTYTGVTNYRCTYCLRQSIKQTILQKPINYILFNYLFIYSMKTNDICFKIKLNLLKT